ncbi:hypothetical protein K2173_009493 [Erythroxylum novogranatense]|uniref:RRM domain-containing protein n=1 Tax=Erythroxylum novogranatense TaxID=1862640 RepID=A0AAV8U430_9ROSI|nr:hypothetical protein K2173_009493 [Erythroxylum novogranatense]
MGKRKPKEVDNVTTSNGETVSSSDVFKSLFGDVERSVAVPSIFSSDNPFKRKPEESKLGSGFMESQENSIGDLEKRKRKKGEMPHIDLGESVDTPLVVRKAKNLKTQIQRLGNESNETSNHVEKGNSELGIDRRGEKSLDKDGSNKKRKKRKRDEVEREYEIKKYGEAPENVENQVVVGQKRKKVDNDADVLISKEAEGFDDESKLLRTVFVGNLPLKVKKKVLTREFSQFGEIESVRIRSVPILDTKVPRKGAIMQKKINDAVDSVHAYIVFRTEQSAEASLAHNMTVVAGNHIRVDRACPPRKKMKGENALVYDNKRTVFVGNLPFDVKDEEIYQLFSGIKGIESSIEAIRVIRHPHMGLGKGIAYVLFKTREAANFVVRKRNLKLRDRELRLSHTKQVYTPSKRRNSFPADQDGSPTKKLGSKIPDIKSLPNHHKSTLAYQGLRASKSGVQKKVHSTRNRAVKVNTRTPNGEKKREGKRPAVAARKAKALNEVGASTQVGKKRKQDSRTPDSFGRMKKAKKFR